MAFQEYKPGRTLEDVLGDSAQNQVDTYKRGRLPGRNSKVSELAATGRLSSGVAENVLHNYDTDTNNGETGIRAGILPSVAQGQLTADSQNRQNTFTADEAEKEYNRNMTLARLLGDMNKPSKLSEIFSGIGGAANLVGNVGKAYASF